MENKTDLFWNETHALSGTNSRIWEQYAAASGSTDKLEINILIASTRLMYDAYNNGWGCNNYTAELDYLHAHGYFEDVSDSDLMDGTYQRFSDRGYFDSEHAKIVEAVIQAEYMGFTKDPRPYDSTEHAWGISYMEWDALLNEDGEEEEEEEEY